MKKIIAVVLMLAMVATLIVACTPETPSTDPGDKDVKAAGVTLNCESKTMSVEENIKLVATVLPENATNKNVVWTSSNDNVAQVNDGTVLAVAAGEATIVVSTVDGGFKATCKITVSDDEPIELTGIKLNVSARNMEVGDNFTLTVSPVPTEANLGELSWSSSDSSIATVSNGKVTAVKAGSVVINVKTKDNKFSATCAVEIKEKSDVDPKKVSGVELNETSKSVISGTTFELVAKVLPSTATNKKVYWTSSDTSVLMILDDNELLAVNPGSAIITVTTDDGQFKSTCQVKVVASTETAVSDITISLAARTIKLGDSYTLKATIWPRSATNQNVIWTSENTKVATVDSNGKITAVGAGTANIVAKSEEGGFYKVCVVTVPGGGDDVVSISLDSSIKTLKDKETLTLTATVIPSSAKVTWSSNNTAVATVDQNGKVTAVGPGIATIKATAGTKSAQCVITIKDATVNVTSITLPEYEKRIAIGDSYSVKATVLPENATNKTLTYTSSNIAVAMITQAGVVVAASEGVALITVTSADGKVQSQMVILVGETAQAIKVSSVSLSETEKEIVVGNAFTLKATILPEDATNKTYTFKSLDESIATVDNSGLVTAKKAGTATIMVTTNDGAKVATCSVKVLKPDGSLEKVKFSSAEYTLYAGEYMTLNLIPVPVNASLNGYTITYSLASGKSVSLVGNKVTASQTIAGEAKIAAYVRDADGTLAAFANCTIIVKVAVSKVELSETAISLNVDATKPLTSIISPVNASDTSVTWTSSNPAVATVDKNGIVTGVAAGNATITCTSVDNPKAKATCTVTVTVAAGSISLDKTEVSLAKTDTITLIATILPDNTSNKNVIWTSSDETIATVDANGLVTAIKDGTAIITAKSAADESLTATCTVTVQVSVETITLDVTSDTTHTVGQSFTLTPTVLPETATNKDVIWTSSDETIATVDVNGLVTIVAAGTCTITAKSVSNESVVANCTVTTRVPVTGLSLNRTSDALNVGEYNTYEVSILPVEATNKEVTWASSDPTKATVDENGKVTAIGVGTVTIYCTSKDDLTIQATITITITSKITALSLNIQTLNMLLADTQTLTPIFTPTDATNKNVLWSTTDSSVATVDQLGVVTAVGEGTCQIIVLSQENSSITALCAVTVLADK